MMSLPISRQDAARELLNRRLAQGSLLQFIDYSQFGVVPARHHKHLIERLEAVERGEIRRLMVFMPPGSAKSTYASILFPAWFLGRHPDRSLIHASHTTELAERWGRRIRNMCAEPRYQLLFPDADLAQDSQAAGRWAMRAGGEYYAAGVGSAIVGFRADLGIIDDPVAGREQADSEREREKIKEWYRSDFHTRLKPNGAIVLIMQRWHEDDLAGWLLREQEKGGERWDVCKLRMEAADDDPLGRSPGEPLWPEWYTDDMRDQAKRDARTWLALYQQEPRPESGGEFKKEWVQHYINRPSLGLNTYILIDPASEKKKNSDYTAAFVVGLGADQNYYILEFVRDRLSLTQRADLVLRLHRKYKPMTVGYEKYGMQADVEHLRDRMEREQYRFPVVELGGQLKKEDRIRRLIPLFEAGRVWFPRQLNYTGSDNVLRDLVRDFIEDEYAPFPVGRHDDMMDCLARITDEALGARFPRERQEQPHRAVAGGGPGWMGA